MPKQDALTQYMDALAQGMTRRVDAYVAALAPEGQPIPMRRVLPRSQALDWWTKNRFTDAGQRALAYLKPTQIVELDNTLAEYAAAQSPLALGVGDATG